MSEPPQATSRRISSGVGGLDDVLHGGFTSGGLHLIVGPAGSGKTTLGLQFLAQGLRDDERVLFLTLSQSETDLRRIARSHGMAIESLHAQELASHDIDDVDATEQTVFHPSEVELKETMSAFTDAIERIRPQRVVLDSANELRLLTGDELGYRRRILALRRYFARHECTTLLLQSAAEREAHEPVRDLAHSVIELQHEAPTYGDVRRRLQVAKVRGATFQGGSHDFTIRHGGLKVFPRLRLATKGQSGQEPEQTEGPSTLSSGIETLDDLLGGGLSEGTSCLVVGPTGAGKSTLIAAYAHAAAQRGERAALFLFEERSETFLERSAQLGLDLRPHRRDGRISLRLVDTGEVSAGEFSQEVMRTVDEGATVVGVDSLTSYYHAMRSEDLLVTQMHSLLMNLSRRGVLTLLTVSQHGIVGTGLHGPDVSYLADNLILLRHFEDNGSLRKAVSVVKQRIAQAEPHIHELHFRPGSVTVGEALTGFQGILAGTPRFTGDDSNPDERGRGGGDGSD